MNTVKSLPEIHEVYHHQVCHVRVFSITCLSVQIFSQHNLPGLNLACFWSRFSSMASVERFSITVTMISPGFDNKVMPL